MKSSFKRSIAHRRASGGAYAMLKGGGLPRWRRDGRELYFMRQSGKMFAVTVRPSASEFGSDPPHELFQRACRAEIMESL
jgi:hypothetical protein